MEAEALPQKERAVKGQVIMAEISMAEDFSSHFKAVQAEVQEIAMNVQILLLVRVEAGAGR